MPLTDLYIVRHGIAEGEHPDHPGRDDARRLTAIGIERTTACAAGARALGIRGDAVWTSPLVRAAQTADLFAEALGSGTPVVRPELSTSSTAGQALEALMSATESAIVIVGHEPILSDLISMVTAAGRLRVEVKKASLTHVRLSPGLRGPIGTLVAHLPPRALRAAGGSL